MRLGSANSVGMWGLALYYFSGPLWLVDTILAVGLILLVTWRPEWQSRHQNLQLNRQYIRSWRKIAWHC